MADTARIGTKQYSGYVFYCVRRRSSKDQPWRRANTIYGRCDTVEQAFGYASEFLAGIDNTVRISIDKPSATKWTMLRERLMQPGEDKRKAGSLAWGAVSIEDKDRLQSSGAAYKKIFDDAIAKHAAWVESVMADHWKNEADRKRQKEERLRQRNEADELLDALRRKIAEMGNGRTQHLITLGLPPTENSTHAIKHAYRKLVSKCHPDKGGNPARFVEVRKAYEALI